MPSRQKETEESVVWSTYRREGVRFGFDGEDFGRVSIYTKAVGFVTLVFEARAIESEEKEVADGAVGWRGHCKLHSLAVVAQCAF